MISTENLYHLLCAFSSSSFYFSTSALSLRKPLLFTMCFFILFFDELDFLWKHDYELNSLLLRKLLSFTMCFPILFPDERTEKTSIIYYVLSHWVHSISRRAHCHWENLYYLLCASSFYSSTSSIFFENTHELNSLLLRKPQSFTMCFLILFLDFLWKHAWIQLALTEKISIIYYVLPHSILRRTHWGNPYHLLCASSFYSSIFFENTHEPNSLLLRKFLSFTMCFPIGSSSPTGALSLRKPLLFTMCFLIESCFSASALPLGNPLLFCMCFLIVFFDERIAIGETSTIWWVLPQLSMFEAWHRPWSWSMPSHFLKHWENLYYLVGASPSYFSASALKKGNSNW